MERQRFVMFGDKMVNKKSRYYLKSEYKDEFYKTENGIKLERDLKVEGNYDFRVRDVTTDIKSKLMP